jgi:hypothetical protein
MASQEVAADQGSHVQGELAFFEAKASCAGYVTYEVAAVFAAGMDTMAYFTALHVWPGNQLCLVATLAVLATAQMRRYLAANPLAEAVLINTLAWGMRAASVFKAVIRGVDVVGQAVFGDDRKVYLTAASKYALDPVPSGMPCVCASSPFEFASFCCCREARLTCSCPWCCCGLSTQHPVRLTCIRSCPWCCPLAEGICLANCDLL